MKNVLITILVLAFIIFGFLFSLIAVYSAPDNEVHFFEASIFWLGDGIALAGLLFYLNKVNK